jgi:peptidoglycan/LPS O-acetylase OafA/YrhL
LPLGIPHPEAFTILWSLAVEEQFYFFWPFVVFLLNEQMLAWVAAAILVMVPILRWFCTPLFVLQWQIYMLTPFRMDLLALGALLAVLWRNHRPQFTRYGAYGGLVSVAAIGLLLLAERRFGLTTHGNTPLGNVLIYECSLFASAGLIVWALSGRHVGILNWGPLRYLGRISYTVYLVHLLALELAARFIQQPFPAACAALATSLLYAALSWRYFEQPILNAKPAPSMRHQST